MELKRIFQSLSIVAALLVTLGTSTLVQAQQDEMQSKQEEKKEYTLQPMTVTATRRAENLQKVSRPIVAVNSEDLIRSGVVNATALPELVPGLTIAHNGSQLQVSIRGVGDRTISPGTDPAVLFSLDGVYMPKSYEPQGAFFDLERVEVLKGPQGTLYGRNATAGAVNLIAVKPKFDFGGFAQLEAGNYSLRRFSGAVNVALSDTVAARLSTQLTDRDGYLTDGFNDDKSQGVRLQVLYEPTETTSLLVSGNYFHLGGIGEAAVIAERFGPTPSVSPVPDPSDPWAGPTDPATVARIAATNPASATVIETIAKDAFQDVDTYVMSATLEHNMDWGSITVIPSLVSSKLENQDQGGLVVAGHPTDKSDQYALEARAASPDTARIKWVFGAYASLEDQSHTDQALIPIFPGLNFNSADVINERNTTTWAVFGEADSDLTDSLHLIAGLRYTQEKKTLHGYAISYGFIPGEDALAGFPLVVGSTFPGTDYPGALVLDGDKDDSAVNFRVGLKYDLTEDSMVYATVATGFKAGGFFHSPVTTDNSFKPEKLTAYTVGSKNRFYNNRWEVNGEAFYWDYKDKQESFVGFVPAAQSFLLQTRNAGKVTLYGVDLSVTGLITSEDLVTLQAEYLHTKFDEYNYFTAGAGAVAYGACTVTDSVQDGIAGQVTDCSGNPLVRAPEWTGRLGYTHTQPMGEKGAVIFDAGLNYSANYYFANDFAELEHQPAFETYDASLTWESASTKWSLTGWGKNLTDENYYTGGAGITTTITDAANSQIAPPRTFGLRLRYNF